jgi:enoyl-CoA hydratase
MDSVKIYRRNTALHLALNNEENRNRLSLEVLGKLREAVCEASLARDKEIRVIVLESSSRKVFCTGADLGELDSATTAQEARRLVHALPTLIRAMRQCPLPVLARIDGLCLAGGIGLALGADVIVCADTAQFGLTEVEVGLWPFIVSAVLSPYCSPKKVLDMMLTAEWIDAAAASELGLVSRVVTREALDDEVERLVAAVSGKSARAVHLGKSAFYATIGLPPEQALVYAEGRLAASLGDPVIRMGLAASLTNDRGVHRVRGKVRSDG